MAWLGRRKVAPGGPPETGKAFHASRVRPCASVSGWPNMSRVESGEEPAVPVTPLASTDTRPSASVRSDTLWGAS